MSDTYQDKVYNQVLSFLKRQSWDFSEKEEINAKRFDVRYGKWNCIVKVYSTGTIQVQGSESKLKETLVQLKQAIERNEVLASEILPF
jgi:hypothetical protein